MIVPIFHLGRLVGFSGTAAHTPDIGGSLGAENRELFEEGVCIPPLHLYRAGERSEDMLALLLNNVRLPDLMLGDLEAQVTANEVCRRRTVDFLVDTGLADLDDLSRAIQACRSAPCVPPSRRCPMASIARRSIWTGSTIIPRISPARSPSPVRP
jgi:N-methylhydantoinase B